MKNNPHRKLNFGEYCNLNEIKDDNAAIKANGTFDQYCKEELIEDALRKPKVVNPDYKREVIPDPQNNIKICPMCGFYSYDKREVLWQIGEKHTYDQARLFGYHGIFLLVDPLCEKQLEGLKCAYTGKPILADDLHCHDCPYKKPHTNNPNQPVCYNMCERVQRACEKV